jgi:RNA polymerase sigma-70 factor (ECF subfamily)
MDDDAATLICAAQAGDQRALAELYRQHYARVCGFLRARGCESTLAEDLAQDTFVRVLRRLASFDTARGVKFISWLFTIATHLHIDWWRKQNQRPEIATSTDIDLELLLAPAPSAESAVVQSMECTRLLASVPRGHATAAVMTQAYGFTAEEAAQMMDIPIGTIKSRTHHGLNKMALAGATQ